MTGAHGHARIMRLLRGSARVTKPAVMHAPSGEASLSGAEKMGILGGVCPWGNDDTCSR